MARGFRTSPAVMRCLRCQTVDYPRLVRRGPGWIAVFLWFGAAVTWTAWTFYGWPGALFVFFIGASLLYTLWYFFKQEQACRECGARELEPHRHRGEPPEVAA
ncbi:MAG: hypothetical protein HY561_12010 [Gemmatimonadetes bacterium]|nr:hypothetical protein [Gemmatimonadota bacterium]